MCLGCHRQLGHVSICFLIVLLTHFYFRDVEQHFSQHLLWLNVLHKKLTLFNSTWQMDQCIVGGFLLQGCVDKREQIMAVALQQGDWLSFELYWFCYFRINKDLWLALKEACHLSSQYFSVLKFPNYQRPQQLRCCDANYHLTLAHIPGGPAGLLRLLVSFIFLQTGMFELQYGKEGGPLTQITHWAVRFL